MSNVMEVELSGSGLSRAIGTALGREFLSLNDISLPRAGATDEQQFLREFLCHFDLLTTCNLRNFARVTAFLKSHKSRLADYQDLPRVVDAMVCWSALDYAAARACFLAHLQEHAGDVIAIFMLHMLDFCTGNTTALIEVMERSDATLSRGDPLFPYYLAIKSFVLCEAGDYEQALQCGLASCELEADNIYAIHAVTHAYHEMDEHHHVLEYLERKQALWIDNPGMKMHVYWHKAIAELRLTDATDARESFRTFYSMKSSPDSEQDLDAVGFLWRYRLAHPHDRQYDGLWCQLADRWTGCIGASTSCFHDLHAAFSFAAANKPLLIKKMIDRSNGVGIPKGARLVGLDILKAIHLYAQRRYRECVAILEPGMAEWPRIGGSGAQRELLHLTLLDAAQRARDPATAAPSKSMISLLLSEYAQRGNAAGRLRYTL